MADNNTHPWDSSSQNGVPNLDPAIPIDPPTSEVVRGKSGDISFSGGAESPLQQDQVSIEEMQQALRPFRIKRIDDNQEWVLPHGESSLGRSRHCALQLSEDGSVSRVHAFITVDADRCLLIDNLSSNGTFIEGARLTPGERSPLMRGQKFSLAKVNFILE